MTFFSKINAFHKFIEVIYYKKERILNHFQMAPPWGLGENDL